MNARLTTMLTVSGALVAGTAAAAVNSTVLNAPKPVAKVAESKAPAVDASSAVTVGANDSDNPSADASSTVAESTSTTAESTTSTTQTPAREVIYQIGDAGQATLRLSEDELQLVSATANDGWTVLRQDDDDDSVVVMLISDADPVAGSPATVVTFRAALVNGVVTTSVSTNHEPVADPQPGTTIGGHDDQGDDDQGDDQGDDHQTEVTRPAQTTRTTVKRRPRTTTAVTTRPTHEDDDHAEDPEDHHEDEHDDD